jgi:hypothetical protein
MNFILFFYKLKLFRVIPSATELKGELHDYRKPPLHGLGANINLSCRPNFPLRPLAVHIFAEK